MFSKISKSVYGDHALSERTCQKWFARFKSGDFDLGDRERAGCPKKVLRRRIGGITR